MYTELNSQFQLYKNEYDNLKEQDLLSVECYFCKNIFYLTKKQARTAYLRSKTKQFYCHVNCFGSNLKQVSNSTVSCKNCSILFSKRIPFISLSVLICIASL